MMIREFSCFTGYGGSTWALKKAGMPHKIVGWSEIDKNAIRCFQQNFPEYKNLNYGDISEIYKRHLPDHDLLTGGFPCQDVSMAGKRDLEKGRTNLYKEMVEIARIKKPKYILMENVAGLLSMRSKGRLLIDIIVNDFKSLGYGVAWKVLNSCDYGVSQSRQRIWIACRLGGWDFMKPNWNFRKIKGKVIADILEPEVDEKYYLSERQVKRLFENIENKGLYNCNSSGNGISGNVNFSDIANTLISSPQNIAVKENHENVTAILQLNNPSHSNDRIYSENGLSPTLNTMQGGNRQPFIQETARIRKLTPRECFRLQGFMEEEINLEGFSDSALYKMAGNGWEINVASLVLRSMLREEG